MENTTNPPPPTEALEEDSLLLRILEELGLVSMYASSRDVKLLCLQRFARMFAYGISTLVFVAFLDCLGVAKTEIGLFMTLTLAGDICISFLLTLFADALGRRAVLALGAVMMAASGVVFALFANYWVLLAAAIVGVISPSGGEIGPFRAIEESIVAQMIDPRNRSDVYAWYNLLGLVGAACGSLVCGWVLQHLTDTLHWELLSAYRLVFVGYAILGLVKLVMIVFLSHASESEEKQRQNGVRNDETAPLLGQSEEDASPSRKRGIYSLLPDISRESIPMVIMLCLLFAINSLGTGVATL
ncbi:hypothetical protein M426DRAFT_316066 [Hypoxylon sp. CI-4A]|nr:hypothetical protein M426DRAFT_316066 [Hypoxylon sp. CI-4A]